MKKRERQKGNRDHSFINWIFGLTYKLYRDCQNSKTRKRGFEVFLKSQLEFQRKDVAQKDKRTQEPKPLS